MAKPHIDPAPTCPVARTVDLIGDRWSLLIVRDAFDGVRRFGDFQSGLGVARSVLTTGSRAWLRQVFWKCGPRLTGPRIRNTS